MAIHAVEHMIYNPIAHEKGNWTVTKNTLCGFARALKQYLPLNLRRTTNYQNKGLPKISYINFVHGNQNQCFRFGATARGRRLYGSRASQPVNSLLWK